MSNKIWNIDFDANSFELKNEGGHYTNMKARLIIWKSNSMLNVYSRVVFFLLNDKNLFLLDYQSRIGIHWKFLWAYKIEAIWYNSSMGDSDGDFDDAYYFYPSVMFEII